MKSGAPSHHNSILTKDPVLSKGSPRKFDYFKPEQVNDKRFENVALPDIYSNHKRVRSYVSYD